MLGIGLSILDPELRTETELLWVAQLAIAPPMPLLCRNSHTGKDQGSETVLIFFQDKYALLLERTNANNDQQAERNV
ncbi:hypothetical protein BaRGS_00031792 [Batillaria attramentaria]|uniref:Uncharacterized protein n=1 Tax=Batillaria attramentaria TaxID=370345 RepID=A0ABD0JPE7_9CAEN